MSIIMFGQWGPARLLGPRLLRASQKCSEAIDYFSGLN
jgi:hypothetical protein